MDNISKTTNICDCELSHNGLGIAGRECDCPAGQPDKTPNPELFHGWPAEKLLDFLPLASGVAISGPQLRGASDAEIAAWVHGVECASDSVTRIIEQWRQANAQP